LLRVVVQGGSLVADEKAVLPGRGAWVHRMDACVQAALRRRAFGRALRVSSDLDTQTFQETHQRKG